MTSDEAAARETCKQLAACKPNFSEAIVRARHTDEGCSRRDGCDI